MTGGWQRGVLRAGGDAGGLRPLVVKLGGSLLACSGWGRDVAALLDSLVGPHLLVVGGGPVVEGLRAIDRAAPQPAELLHGLAIECMGHTARLVAAEFGAPLVAEPDAADRTTAVLDTPAWLAREGRLGRLPVGWHVTSDSIAALVAAACGGGLLLVKSVAPPHGDLAHLAAAGWVDGFFPTAARPVPWIGWSAPS